jgi:hypothetical protein
VFLLFAVCSFYDISSILFSLAFLPPANIRKRNHINHFGHSPSATATEAIIISDRIRKNAISDLEIALQIPIQL